MLKQVFQSEPLKYRVAPDPSWWFPFGFHYGGTVPPYYESTQWPSWVTGLFSYDGQTRWGPTSLHLLVALRTDYWPSWNMGGYRFDAVTGKILAQYYHGSLGFVLLDKIKQGSSGVIYLSGEIGGPSTLTPCSMNEYFMTTLDGDPVDYNYPKRNDGLPSNNEYAWPFIWTGQTPLIAQEFKGPHGFGYNPDGDSGLYSFGGGGDFAVDDVSDVLIDCSDFLKLSIYKISTRKWMYDIPVPDLLVSIALEDPGRCYVMMRTGLIVLVDYLRGEIMGAGKLPDRTLSYGSSPSGYWNQGNDVDISWDRTYKRLLVCELSPDNADGTATTCIRGYRMVPDPVRMTLPIPLKKPRQGRIIPVMSQVVGDLNEGVGGHVVKATVGGSGSLIGIPVTDHHGVAIMQVACEGNEFYRPNPPEFDYEGTGSPEGIYGPNAGMIDVVCSVDVWQPEQEILPPLANGLITPENPTGQHPLDEPDSGEPGTKSNPIIAMSSDPAQIHRDVEASWNHYNPIGVAAGRDIGSVDYWVGYCDHVGDKFSNGKYYLGWNLYWEVRMEQAAIGDYSGATDPNQANEPARYRA